jgi:hypothetical protein
VVKDFGVSSTVNGFLNMIPWGIGVMGLLVIPRILINDRVILSAAAVITGIGSLCFLTGVLAQDAPLRFIALAIGCPCIAVLNPCFWIFPTRMFAGARAAASIAAINSIGNFGGFLAQNLAPWVEQLTRTVVGPMLVPALSLALLCLLALIGLVLPRRRA